MTHNPGNRKLPIDLIGAVNMRRSEKDLALSIMDLHNRAVTYGLTRTTDALRLAMNVVLIEVREREEAEIVTDAQNGYDRNGDVIR
jgi:hypothetical protein